VGKVSVWIALQCVNVLTAKIETCLRIYVIFLSQPGDRRDFCVMILNFVSGDHKIIYMSGKIIITCCSLLEKH
jgi:hypothetical protein